MLKKLFLFITLLSVSCCSLDFYSPTTQSKINIIQRQDHQKCISQGLDDGEWNDVKTEIYWHCRYDLLTKRKSFPVTSQVIYDNYLVKYLSIEVLQNWQKAQYAVLIKMGDDIVISDHNRCILLNGNLSTKTLSHQYYQCRKDLVLNRFSNNKKQKEIDIFKDAILLLKLNSTEPSIEKEIKIRNDKKTQFIKEYLEKYPKCSELDIKSNDFKKCSKASEEVQKCLSNIEFLKERKILENSILCHNQSLIQFNDNYLKSQNKKLIEKKLNKDSDRVAKFSKNKPSRNQQYKNPNQNYSADIQDKTRVSEQKLETKIEILDSRSDFFYKCNQKNQSQMIDFVKKLEEDCLKLLDNVER